METTGTPSGSASGQTPPQTGGSFLPWHLIPSFKPGETDINDYSRRMTFLSGIWPSEHLSLLAPRAALACEGSAFQKVVRLDPTKLKVNSVDGVQLLVKTLGGTFGKTTLENRFERFERAIYTTSQKPDESHESYVARHEVQFEDLMSQGVSIADVRAYVLLRNSGLSAEEKKRVIIDAGGDLSYDRVIAALKLLGSKFFHEVQTGTKSGHRNKTYDVNMTEEFPEMTDEGDEIGLFSSTAMEDYALEVLYSEGDSDAVVVAQFEDQILETLQNDPEVASCLNTYLDARKRLSDKAKHRGFWGGSKGGKSKGRSKGKSPGKNGRRSLEWRIANSFCKACGQQGHWKAECPNRSKSDGPSGSAFAGVVALETPTMTTWDVIEDQHPPEEAVAFVLQAGFSKQHNTTWHHQRGKPKGEYLGVNKGSHNRDIHRGCLRRLFDRTTVMQNRSKPTDPIEPRSQSDVSLTSSTVKVESAHFVSQGMCGIVDLGASLSVIGENQFRELCSHLPKTVLKRMKEAPCSVNFRFGNDSTVQGRRAVYIPLKEWWLKIVIVPSNTPFLIANSVFRALEAVIDTGRNQIFFRKLQCTAPITLTDRKLYLLDLESLLSQIDQSENAENQQPLVCQCMDEDKSSQSFSHDPTILTNKDSSHAASMIDINAKVSSNPCASMIVGESHSGDSVRLKTCSDNLTVTSPLDVPIQEHGLHRPGIPISSTVDQRSDRTGDSSHPSHDICPTEGLQDGFRRSQKGTALFQGGSGSALRAVVHGDLPEQSSSNPPSSIEVHSAP